MILPLKRKASKKLEKIKHLPLGVGALPLSTDTFSRLFTLFIFLLHLNFIYVYETDFTLGVNKKYHF